MAQQKKFDIVPHYTIVSQMYLVRVEKVMLDSDLAELYTVPVKRLKEAVRRNRIRFPKDFLFELTEDEYRSLRTQIATLKRGKHSKYLPFAFIEQGVAMLSGVLRGPRAVAVHVQMMRTFVQLRRWLSTHKELERKLDQMERRYDGQFKIVFDAIRLLMKEESAPKHKLGF